MYRNKQLVLGFCVLLLAVFLFACCPPVSEKASEKKGNQVKETKKEQKKIPTAKMNENIQVGEVRWKVLEVQQPADIKGKAASGKWTIVHLEAELLGKETGSISSSQLILVDSKDREFESNSEGNIQLSIMEEKKTFMFTDVNPNVPVDGWAAFDIAKDASGLKVKIKDLRMFSEEYGLVELGL